MPTKPIRPLTATALAAASAQAAITIGPDPAGRMPSVRASSSPTDSTSRCLPCSRMTAELTAAYGRIVGHLLPGRGRQRAEQPAVDRLDVGRGALQEERLDGGEEAADGDPGEQQRRDAVAEHGVPAGGSR